MAADIIAVCLRFDLQRSGSPALEFCELEIKITCHEGLHQ